MARRVDGSPWWADFPEPKAIPPRIEPAEVYQLLQEQEQGPSRPMGFLIVDTRRTDCTGGTVHGAINLPAHSFYPTRKALYDLCIQAGVKKVIFYCGESKTVKQTPLIN